MATSEWRPDPYGIHEKRFFALGRPSARVSDNGVESWDDPPTTEPPPRSAEPPPVPVGATMSEVPAQWVSHAANRPAVRGTIEASTYAFPGTAQRACPNGHSVGVGDAFCQTCGAVLASSSPQDRNPIEPLPQTTTVPTPSPRRRGRTIAVLICLALLLGGGWLWWRHSQTGGANNAVNFNVRHTITGTIALTDDATAFAGWTIGKACSGSGSYADVNPGSQVVVKDGSGNVIANGSLDAGTASSAIQCNFNFTVPKVPTTGSYRILVDRRSVVTYSLAQMQGANWNLNLTLGGL